MQLLEATRKLAQVGRKLLLDGESVAHGRPQAAARSIFKLSPDVRRRRGIAVVSSSLRHGRSSTKGFSPLRQLPNRSAVPMELIVGTDRRPKRYAEYRQNQRNRNSGAAFVGYRTFAREKLQ